MTENIVWLDFNDAIDPREAQLNDTEVLRAGLLDRLESVLLASLTFQRWARFRWLK